MLRSEKGFYCFSNQCLDIHFNYTKHCFCLSYHFQALLFFAGSNTEALLSSTSNNFWYLIYGEAKNENTNTRVNYFITWVNIHW